MISAGVNALLLGTRAIGTDAYSPLGSMRRTIIFVLLVHYHNHSEKTARPEGKVGIKLATDAQ